MIWMSSKLWIKLMYRWFCKYKFDELKDVNDKLKDVNDKIMDVNDKIKRCEW